VGPCVDELRNAVWRTHGWREPLEIDVADLTFADDEGENALCWLHRWALAFTAGVRFPVTCSIV